MILGKEVCLGGHFNGKDVLGIKYDGFIIYPWEDEEDYSEYILVYASQDTDNLPVFHSFSSSDYIVNRTVDSDGLIITRIKPVDENKLPVYISFRNSLETLRRVIKFCGAPQFTNYAFLSEGKFESDVICFRDCELLKYVNLNEFDISNTFSLSRLFDDCHSLTIITGLDKLDTSDITDMSAMFCNCKKIKSIDFSSFDVSSVTDMSMMFNDCESIKRLDLSSFYTDSLINTNNMFYICYELEEVDMRNFDMTNVPKKSTGNSSPGNYEMFGLCNNLRVLRLDNCNSDTIDKIITSYRFPTGTINGETRKIYCREENAAELTLPEGWEFVYVTYEVPPRPEKPEKQLKIYEPGEFEGNSNITLVNTLVTLEHTDLSNMFKSCSNLGKINGIDKWDTSNVTDMSEMFLICSDLMELDLSNFDMDNVTDTSYMFQSCISLHTLRLDNCSYTTINKIITSTGFPTSEIKGVTRKIYVKQENTIGLTAPTGWVFEYVD